MNRYYLIDSENVGNSWLKLLPALDEQDKIDVFYTKNSGKLEYDCFESISNYIKKGQLNFIKGDVGKNGLDFQLSTYLGIMVGKNQDYYYYIVSKDKGFDVVIQFLNHYNVAAKRIVIDDEIDKMLALRTSMQDCDCHENQLTLDLVVNSEIEPKKKEEKKNGNPNQKGKRWLILLSTDKLNSTKEERAIMQEILEQYTIEDDSKLAIYQAFQKRFGRTKGHQYYIGVKDCLSIYHKFDWSNKTIQVKCIQLMINCDETKASQIRNLFHGWSIKNILTKGHKTQLHKELNDKFGKKGDQYYDTLIKYLEYYQRNQ